MSTRTSIFLRRAFDGWRNGHEAFVQLGKNTHFLRLDGAAGRGAAAVVAAFALAALRAAARFARAERTAGVGVVGVVGVCVCAGVGDGPMP